jgi:kynurenine formamidase
MSRFVDLSHVVHDGMPGISVRRADGSVQEGTARIRTWLSREAMSQVLNGEAAFEVSELSLPTPIGTYIDSPFNRYAEGRDISELTLDELILPGVVIDLRGHAPGPPAPAGVLSAARDLQNAAVLFNFGWDRHWGADAYATYPHIATELARAAADRGARLLGFDTGNADGPGVAAHPVHTEMLARGVLIVENLTGLDRLHGKPFRFFAVPIKGRGLASMSVRAFAELL